MVVGLEIEFTRAHTLRDEAGVNEGDEVVVESRVVKVKVNAEVLGSARSVLAEVVADLTLDRVCEEVTHPSVIVPTEHAVVWEIVIRHGREYVTRSV